MKRYENKNKKENTRRCDVAGCPEAGEYRAPKDRTLRDYYWFCLKHVKEYNKNWDFLKGLSADEIEEHLQNDITWQRPTWKLGHGGIKADPKVKDYFRVREDVGLGMDGRHNPPPPAPENRDKRLVQAVAFMELSFPLVLADVKKRYKKLAKQYHPDTNRGDTEAAKRFQALNEAYHYIVEHIS